MTIRLKTSRIYLASPYGFSRHWKERLLPDLINVLEEFDGLEVLEPFQGNSDADFNEPGVAHNVALKNLKDVYRSDAIFAVVNGTPPDEGVMIELGASIAWGKEIFLFRDDFRQCSDSMDYPLNLMLFAGLPWPEWKNNYFSSVDEIRNCDKGLSKWLNNNKLID